MMDKGFVILIAFILIGVCSTCDAAEMPRGWLIIPDIALYAPIQEAPIVNRQYVIPAYGVAHLEGTAWVDDGQFRTVLAGHAPGVFEDLNQLVHGDRVIVKSHIATYDYRITNIVITGDTVHWLMPTDTAMLTLITCLDRGDTWLVLEAQEAY